MKSAKPPLHRPSRALRVGIDATCWANRRGYGRYARELVTSMVERAPDVEFLAFLDRRAIETFEIESPNVRTVLVEPKRSPTEAAVANDNRSPRDMLRFTRAVWREAPDVFFFPSVYTFFPLPPRQKAVVAIHDAIAERFPELTLPSRRARAFWRMKVGLAITQSRLVLTVSDYARLEIERMLSVPRDRIRVAVEAPAPVFRPDPSREEIAKAAAEVGLPEGARWFIYVGGFNPHKNVHSVIEAHGRLAQEVGAEACPRLLLVGSKGSEGFHGDFQDVLESIAAAGTTDIVHCPGFVPDEQLASLYSGALALLLLSESEGFGLPGVEAAACACPVIATTESPLPQLLAGGGYFVAPADVVGALNAMRELTSNPDLRTSLGEAAKARADQLGWHLASEAAMDALRDAAQ